MTKKELIEEVKDELTATASLPFSPPDKEIERIIDLESRWLYREYRDSWYTRWYILDKKYYQDFLGFIYNSSSFSTILISFSNKFIAFKISSFKVFKL